MHTAYNVQSILERDVESLAAFDNKILIGTKDGRIQLYTMGAVSVRHMLVTENGPASKKPIVQLDMVPAQKILFVLQNALIHIYELKETEHFGLVCTETATNGCVLYTLDVIETSNSEGTVTSTSICCAFKRCVKFFYWNSRTSHLMRFKRGIDLKQTPRALSWRDDMLCVGFAGEYRIYQTSIRGLRECDIIQNSCEQPCICVVESNIPCVAVNRFLNPLHLNRGPFAFDQTTLPSLEWSSRITAVVWDEPYVVAQLQDCVEVRSFSASNTLVQTIPLKKIKFLKRSTQGMIIAASASEIWCFRMEDSKVQIEKLLSQKEYQLAIALASTSPEPDDVKGAYIRKLRIYSAQEFFKRQNFTAAMEEFIKAEAEPSDVIRLFPSLCQMGSNRGHAGDDKESTERGDTACDDSIVALVNYLKWAREREIARLEDGGHNSSLLTVIDTTILKCYVQLNDPLIPSLLRLNRCHFKESENILKEANKTLDLIELYKANRKHRKVLELLKIQSCLEGSSICGYDHIIEYLQSLGLSHLKLIFEFANWVLQQDPEAGLAIFTKHLIEVENLPRASVLNFLLSNHRPLVIPYLEHVIHVWNDHDRLIHHQLIKEYRKKIQNLKSQTETDGDKPNGKDSESLKAYRESLQDFLKNSNSYSMDAVLKDFPTNIMPEERALILFRLKRHTDVLAIYTQILGDLEKALQYCDENYRDDNDVFIHLIRIILNNQSCCVYDNVAFHPEFLKMNQDTVLSILNDYAPKIHINSILPLLPDDMPMRRLVFYMDKFLRTQMAATHQNIIAQGLRQAECAKLKQMTSDISVEMNSERECRKCKRGFQQQNAFWRYPNGDVEHLGCRTHEEYL